MKHKTAMAICAIACLVAIMLSCTGCGTYKFAVAGSVADVATTAYALQYDGMQEGNWFAQEDDCDTVMILIGLKALLLWIDYETDNPTVHNIVGGLGFAAAAWNTTQIMEAERNK